MNRNNKHVLNPSVHNLWNPAARALLMLVLLVGVVSASIVNDANARLHSGEVSLLPGDTWDFSDSSSGTFSTYDVTYAITAITASHPADPSRVERLAYDDTKALFDLVHAAVSMAYIGYAGTVYEDLEEAPTDPLAYENDYAVFPDEVYVIKTREVHYAKIKIISRGGVVVFKYTYQDDGSTSFIPPVATQPVTWGRVKALFR